MAATKVPLVPQWNLTGGCVCTPDGGFLYVGARSINYIGKFNDGEVPLVKAFHSRQSIQSLDVDPAWPQEHTKDTASQPKRFAVVAQDNSVQIWDFDKGCAVTGHKAHFNIARYLEGRSLPHHTECLMSYMSNSSVLSMSATDLVVYCVASNSYCRRSSFLPMRGQQWVILRCSPYNEHMFAVGSTRGLVILCDLQKMQVLYTLRGHDAAITSLSWIMFENVTMEQTAKQDDKPVVVKPSKPELIKQKHSIDTDDIFDIYDYDYLENEFGAPSNVDRGQIEDEEPKEMTGTDKSVETTTSTNFDFVEACMSLKQDIDALKSDPPLRNDDNDDVVTLADCNQVKNSVLSSPSCSNDSTEGSLELIDHSSSDEGVDVDGIERKPKQQILLHQAEVHATQTLERNKEVPTDDDEAKQCDKEPKEQFKAKEVNECTEISEPKVDQQTLDKCIQQNAVLLASASVDCNFWIWNALTGAACDNWTMRSGISGNNTNGQGKNTHIEIAWLKTTRVITNNKHGELAIWSIKPQSSDNKSNFKFVEEKQFFASRSVVAFEIGKNRNAHRMWSITSNREVICEDLNTQELVAKYCCASTNISIMRECPDDMNKIALGFSDRRVGILDISKLASNNVYIENFSQRIDSAVLSVVWSPDNKKLAFGTMEGRVGIINVENTKQQTITYNPVSGKPIYSIDWKDNNIFVICNDDLAIYDADAKTKDATVVGSIGKVTAISVHGDFIFAGTKVGTIKILRQPTQTTTTTRNWNELTVVQELPVGSRYISDFSWNPIATQLCAVACNENKIVIFEFNFETGVAVYKRRIRIKHPKAANGSIKWSNRDEHLLVTSGFDGFIRVWDLRNEQDEEKYFKHFQCPMLCALFLPTNEDIVMCTGKSTSVEFIDMRVECSSSNADATTNTKRSNSHALDNVQWATKMLLSNENNNNKATSAKEKRRKKRILAGVDLEDANQQPVVEPSQQTPDAQQVPMQDNKEITEMLGNLKINTMPVQICNSNNNSSSNKCSSGEHCAVAFMKNSGTLLYLATKELNKDALEKLRSLLTTKNVQKLNKDFLCYKLFGNKGDATELLKTELNNHQHCAEKGISTLFMTQLGSNLKDEIVKCIQKRTLNAWHVAMAPSISYNFWQKCGQAYAEQLLEEGYALQAASYMLAQHKQCDAIDMLMQGQYYKEALLLARIYLQPNDPLLNTIIDKWITHIDLTGNLAGAAMLCALSGQMNRAHDILSKYRNPPPEVENVLKLMKQK